MDEYIVRKSDIIKRAVAKIPRNIVTEILRDKTFFMRYLVGYAILYSEKMDDVLEFIEIFARTYYDVPLKKIRVEIYGGFGFVPKISIVWQNDMYLGINMYRDNHEYVRNKLESIGFTYSKKSLNKMKYNLC